MKTLAAVGLVLVKPHAAPRVKELIQVKELFPPLQSNHLVE
jgi:hypothetical protein